MYCSIVRADSPRMFAMSFAVLLRARKNSTCRSRSVSSSASLGESIRYEPCSTGPPIRLPAYESPITRPSVIMSICESSVAWKIVPTISSFRSTSGIFVKTKAIQTPDA